MKENELKNSSHVDKTPIKSFNTANNVVMNEVDYQQYTSCCTITDSLEVF